MNKKNNNGFTLIELIITLVILWFFSLFAWRWFTNILVSLNWLRALWIEQKEMLYDDYILDSYLDDSVNLKTIKYIKDWNYNTWYLFENNSLEYNYPFSFLSFLDDWDWYKHISLKNILLLNDFVEYDWVVYYSEPGNNTIKSVENNDILENIWTGILNNPTGLLNIDGKIYIGDTWNSCIRVYDGNLSNCIIWSKQIPWDTSKLLVWPTYLAYDWTDIYISDTYQNKIRKVNLSDTWSIIDIFWNGDSWDNIYSNETWTWLLLNHPTWIVFYDSKLYVADTWNNRILQLDTSTWSWKILLWNGLWKTEFLWGQDLWINNISISSPTNLKIYDWKLYFNESISWVIKMYDFSSNKLFDIVWNTWNIAYFWDFEKNNEWSYSVNWWSGEIVWEDEILPYEWNNSLKITSSIDWDISLKYNFSWTVLKEDQFLDFWFYLKSLTWSYVVWYWPTYNDNFVWSYFTWSITDFWNWYRFSNTSNNEINWVLIKIYDVLDWDIFYMDDLNIKFNNLFMDNNMHKFESHFSNITWFILSSGWDFYFSDIYSWNNYKISNWSNVVFKIVSNLIPINWDFLSTFPDDYFSQLKLIRYFVDIVSPPWFSSLIWVKLELETYNWASLYKNISIK